MAGSARESDDTPPQYSVADPEEFNQTERLRTINHVRKQAGEAIQATMTQLRTDEEFDVSDRQQILRAAVYRYLTEIEWLVDAAEDTEVLGDIELGVVELHPPEHLLQLTRDRDGRYPRVIGNPDLKPWTHGVQGFVGYLTAPEVFQHTWTIQVDTRHGGPQPIRETMATYMPAHISLNAYRLANRFLAKNGIDVELAEKEHRAVVDKELLEELEEWRQQNIK